MIFVCYAPKKGNGIVSAADLIKVAKGAKTVIRTGETDAYANVLLVSVNC